ncbi:FKBP-type peptidyl-prolyl cis-trans isomerase N-terminal domain-containing protein [Geobacter sp. FeAm09]|uniref:FKBP-type peptidyl-prolyl cis-trans isomerase N-terminal domain-containing protein n=1 Tax=Geobacter sp. FeAm09 TaxID=2597769 RepID=UPI00143DB25E|nr:FKBP-type peptidyl-prolyl cis-trans isomerase N-terminal domain-containing protein [Geobacter sp. FeAm09]
MPHCPPAHGEDRHQLNSPGDKIQYAIGVEVARNFKNQGLDLDLEMVAKGMRDGLSGGELLVSEKELRSILISVQSDIRRRQSLVKQGAAGDRKP